MRVHTFSLVAHDPQSGDLGIAVASKFLAVGFVVPWAKAAVGAVATQSYANPAFGPQGLALLQAGAAPQEVLAVFQRTDPQLHLRQFGLVSANGQSLSFTGEGCHPWAGGVAGEGFAAQGNLLQGPEVIESMVQTYQNSPHLPFAERLLAALLAADLAGGDRRGRQSAALLIVGEGRGYGGMERAIDLRVDDHPQPVPELQRLLSIHRLLFSKPQNPEPLSTADILWIQQSLGLPLSGQWNPATEEAFRAWIGHENLEERYPGGPYLDLEALAYLKTRQP